MSVPSATPGSAPSNGKRWAQLALGVACMVLIANFQYGWTLFVGPMQKAHGWSAAEIQIAFSIFVALETWLTPLEGWIVDWVGPRHGPPSMVAFGGIMVAIGWTVNAYSESIAMLYLGAAVTGVGAGAIYATCVGNCGEMVPGSPRSRGRADRGRVWRRRGADGDPDPRRHRRRRAISPPSCGSALVRASASFILALVPARRRSRVKCRQPKAVATIQSARSYTPGEMLSTPIFWLLYVMFVLVSAQRPDGDGADRADRQGFQHRQLGAVSRRHDA